MNTCHRFAELRPVIGITADIEGDYLRLNMRYASAIENTGACPVVLASSRNIKNIASRIDGLLVSGGNDLHPSYYGETPDYDMKIVAKERSDFELEMLYEIMGLRKPVLGICYGMQFINVALGGSLYQDIGSQIPMALDHKKGYHIIRVIENKLVDSGEFNVNSSHHQAVKNLGRGLRSVAYSEDGIVEAVCMDDYPFLLGVQWHPERMNDGFSEKLFSSFVERAYAGK